MPDPIDSDARTRHAQRVREGQVAFNCGKFFEAHEIWEELWRDLVGRERVAVQGLIQIAAALHHLQQGRSAPAVRLIDKGARKVSQNPCPELLADLRVDALVRALARLVADLGARQAVTPDLSGIDV